MEQLRNMNVFPVAPTGAGQITYNGRSFEFQSHKAGGAKIYLPPAAMDTMVQLLPLLLDKVKRLQFHLDGKVQEDALHNSAGIQSTSLLPPDRTEEKIVINKSQPNPNKPDQPLYQATLLVSTYNQKATLWLKCFFEVPDKNKPGEIAHCCCRGGSILNDIDVVGLAKFVSDCTGRK